MNFWNRQSDALLRSIRCLLAVLAVCALMLPASIARTQEKQKPPKPLPIPREAPQEAPQEPDVKLRSDLVLLDVMVVDQNNLPVLDVRKDQLQVFEDRVQQQVDFFSKEEVPISAGLVIDTSGSMRGKLDSVIKSAITLVEQSKKDDEFLVIEFKDPEQINLVQDFTTNIGDVEDALRDLLASGGTALLDAISVAADHAQKNGKNRRKALIVISDGLDEDSVYKKEDVIEGLKERDVQIYLVGFTNDLSEKSPLFKRSPRGRAEKLLTQVAEGSGGRVFFPKDSSEIGAVTEQIGKDLRTQYLVGYYPTNEKLDGSYRQLSVKVTDSARRLIAKTRAGYYATKTSRTSAAPVSR